MAKFIVEAKSASDLHRGNFEVIEPYKDRCFEDAIRDQEALEMQGMYQYEIEQLEKKLAILASTIEENELMDYHLSKACFEDEKKLKRKISDLKKQRSELKQRMVNQDNRNRDLHRDLDSLERDKILLEAENQQLRKIVAQDKMIEEDFVIKDSKDLDWSNMSFDYSDSAGCTEQVSDWVNLIILRKGESIKCTKDQFMGVEVGDTLTVKDYSYGYYTFLVNKKQVTISEKSITDDCFERLN